MKHLIMLVLAVMLAACATDNRPTPAFTSAVEIETNDGARALNDEAVAVLVLPNIVKAGLMAGGGIQGTKITRRLRKN